ncbi:MAG: ferritin family protein [bacterium]
MNNDYTITSMTSMKEILEMAVRRAEKCYTFYKTASDRAPIKSTKEMLLQIAKDEKDHKKKLLSALEELNAQMEIDEAITGEW